MENKNEKIYDEIKEILEKNEDAYKGFKKASENADSTKLRSYFQKKSNERAEFNSELRKAIAASYSDFDENGSFTGTIHRAWMDIKSLFSADDDESMLEESIRGDKAAIEEYNDVIEYENIPANIRTLLISQREKISKDIAKNNSLESMS